MDLATILEISKEVDRRRMDAITNAEEPWSEQTLGKIKGIAEICDYLNKLILKELS